MDGSSAMWALCSLSSRSEDKMVHVRLLLVVVVFLCLLRIDCFCFGYQQLNINLLPAEDPRERPFWRRLSLNHASRSGSPALSPSNPPEIWSKTPWGQAPGPSFSPSYHGSFASPPVSNHQKGLPHAVSPTVFTPPQAQDCEGILCSEPLTLTPIGSPCACVYPMQVVIDVGIDPYVLFNLIRELEIDVAAGTFIKQSQVKIIEAHASSRGEGRTTVSIDLVPLGEKFDNYTALLIFDRFWQKKVPINKSTFNDYEVIYVRYPGLPSSPPSSGSFSVSPGGESRQFPITANVTTGKAGKMNARIIAVLALTSFLLVFVCLGMTIFVFRSKKFRQPPTISESASSTVTRRPEIKATEMSSITRSASVSFLSPMATCPISVKTFLLTQLEKATDGFSSRKLLGEGGSSRVYHGIMEDGCEVAVKLLKRLDQDADRECEFISEVEMLSRLHHRNLVKLIGICIEGHRRCLIYELIRNGSVESHLHASKLYETVSDGVGRMDTSKSVPPPCCFPVGDDKREQDIAKIGADSQCADKSKGPLDWDARMKIALGAARALAYLHEDSNPRVIHRDFKASNVLLEVDFTPKVSDFGLAKEALEGNHHLSTRVMGTFGYVAPEYAMTGHLLIKSDVYSYGVVLLELLSGRKPVFVSNFQDPQNLVTWARPLLGSREGLEQLLDPSLQGKCEFDNMARVAAVASMCVQFEPSQRPFMGEVVQALKLICSSKEDACEDSYSKEESSFGPDYEYRGDFGATSSWWSGASPPLAFGPYGYTSPFMTMEYGSPSMEEIRRPHSVSGLVGRPESLARHNSSGPLRTKRQQQAFYRLRGSVSEHGHPLRYSNI